MPIYFTVRSKYWINTTWVHNFPKIYGQPQHFRCQRGDWKQVPYSRPTNIRHHHTKFSHPGNLAPRTCTPLQYSRKIISNSYKFYLNHTENWYTYITAKPCHLQGLHSWKIPQTVELCWLMLRPHKKIELWELKNTECDNIQCNA